MNKYILIRGPVSIGKTTVAKELSDLLNRRELRASELSFDYLRSQNGISEPTYMNKQQGTQILAVEARHNIESGTLPVIEGVFYEREFRVKLKQIIQYQGIRIYLRASLEFCLNNDAGRTSPRGIEKVSKIWELSQESDEDEIIICADRKSPLQISREISAAFEELIMQ